MPSLYELDVRLLELESILTDYDGEFPEGEFGEFLEQLFDDTTVELHEKLDNIMALRQDMLARSHARAEESLRLAQLAARDDSAADRLKQRVWQFMVARQIPKLELRRFKLAVCGNGGVEPLIVAKEYQDAPDRLPVQFQRVTTNYAVNTEALRQALASDNPEIRNEAAKYAAIAPRGTHLRIK